MPMPKIADARALSDEELSQEIYAVKKELFELRLQQATRQLNQPHLIRLRKHKLAQLLTVESERKRNKSLSSTQTQKEE
ncbi:50S ribosomal protein L29 [Synechococcus sp. H60.4]|uniref:50S ribosomal protein L29 n=1 Tax=unclassified Synechococcus TaxID=2626047 RepID=UPI0039C268EF